MSNEKLKQILESPITKGAKGRFMSIEELEQIKTIFEAWEVVKEDIEYSEVQSCEERPEYTYEFKKWIFEINEEQGDFEEKSTKLKKALEVENEQI